VIKPGSLAMNELPGRRPIVVGIDGSQGAIRAALWAVDEAVSRDVPLRLLYAIEQGDAGGAEPETMARKLVTAETAVGRAVTAIEAIGQPVKIETEVAQGPAIGSLIRASGSAAMVCVGALGLRHFRPGRVGSTAAALAISAQCPVAIIRDHQNRPGQSARGIVVEVDSSPDNGVLLGAAIDEARLRNATLRAVICRRTVSDDAAQGEGDRRALADLDRRLSRWKRRYPHLRVESLAVHGTLMEYLAHNRRSVGLAMVGAHNRPHVRELVGPVGSAILQDADCSLLIVNRQHLEIGRL
jgi:nucleotide-binding universal stress UspA family protein